MQSDPSLLMVKAKNATKEKGNANDLLCEIFYLVLLDLAAGIFTDAKETKSAILSVDSRQQSRLLTLIIGAASGTKQRMG